MLVMGVLRVQVHFFKIGRKSLVKETESIPAADYFWLIVRACVQNVKQGAGARQFRTEDRVRTLNLPKYVIV